MRLSDLLELTPYYFELKCKGFTRLKDDEEELFRKVGWINVQLHGDPKAVKKTSIDDIWPSKKGAQKQKVDKVITKGKAQSIMEKFMAMKNITPDGR